MREERPCRRCDTPGCLQWLSKGKGWKCKTLHREQKRRQRQTPGTYEYNYKHGIGIPGARERLTHRIRDRRLAAIRDQVLAEQIISKYPELEVFWSGS